MNKQTAYDWYAGLAVAALIVIAIYLFVLAWSLNEIANNG